MPRLWKLFGEIQETRTLAVSGSGGGLYLYMPKRLCETYNIIAGDQVKVTMRTHLKRDYVAEEKGEGKKGRRGRPPKGEIE